MRCLLALLILLAGIGAARAADDRLVPTAGATFTYRLITVTKRPDNRTITTGQVNLYAISSSDDTVAEGTIKTLALIYGCATTAETARDCAAALKAPGVKQDGDLVIVPVPSEIGDNLAKQSALKYRYFIAEQRKIAMPGPKDPKADTGEFGPDPAIILSSGLVCDAAMLQRFFPLGHVADLTVPCKQTLSLRPGPGSSLSPVDSTHDMSAELIDNGAGHVTVPSGDFDVRKLTLKETSSNATPTVVTGDIAFSTRLGVAVKTHSTVTAATPSGVVVETDSELIATTP
jgi:hypothetical protein